MPGTGRMNQEQNNMNELPIVVKIVEHAPESGVLATAEVNIGGLVTVRNVKIKEDDYGLNVVMPRTKMPYTEQYKDSVFFATKEMRDRFDMVVKVTYQQEMGMEQEMEEPAESEVEDMTDEMTEGMEDGMENDNVEENESEMEMNMEM